MWPIYLSSLSVRRSLLRGALSLVELPEVARARGFDGIEVSDRELDVSDRDALARFAISVERAGAGLVLDLNGDLTMDSAETNAYLERIRKVVEVGRGLGVSVVRLTLGGQRFSLQRLWGRKREGRAGGAARATSLRRLLARPWVTRSARAVRRCTPVLSHPKASRVARAVEALQRAAAWADASGVTLAVENHWGVSTRPGMLAGIVRQAGSSRVGVCLDFGNLPVYVSKRRAFEVLAPLSVHAHVSCLSRRPGPLLRRQVAAGLATLARHGYGGAIAVERVAGGDELEGAREVRELLAQLGSRLRVR